MKKSAYFLMLTLLVTACVSPKKILYIQDANINNSTKIEQSYEIKIHKDDLLSITVKSKNEELAAPFNMTDIKIGENTATGYLVDSEGNIDFPFLGKIQVVGLTRLELSSLIKETLTNNNYIKDAIVTVKLLNNKISVIGEVSRPGTFNINSERVTIFEALSLAGDLTIYGKRDKVYVIRENDGERAIHLIDLRSSSIFTSPCYYLQQNDVVYVEPNKSKASQSAYSSTFPIVLSGLSVFTSILFFILK